MQITLSIDQNILEVYDTIEVTTQGNLQRGSQVDDLPWDPELVSIHAGDIRLKSLSDTFLTRLKKADQNSSIISVLFSNVNNVWLQSTSKTHTN